MTITSIFASTLNGGIGRRNKLPWVIREDMRNFEHVTTHLHANRDDKVAKNAMLMGRKTWESLPKKPLPDRLNYVISQKTEIPSAHKTVKSIQEGLRALNDAGCSTIYITGGAGIYDEAHDKGVSDYIIWTRVCGPKIEVDVSLNQLKILKDYVPIGLSKSCRSGNYTYDIALFRKADLPDSRKNEVYEDRILDYINKVTNPMPPRSMSFSTSPSITRSKQSSLIYRGHEEFQYLDIMRDIMTTGVMTDDRTGVGTVSKFGALMRFDLSQTFPLLTTKRVYWKGVVEELLWFLRGDTDGLKLSAADVHIWDGNGSKEFLKSRGLGHRREGDLGPVYGFQWRHFGAPYTTCDADYSGKGVDQIKDLIKQLIKDPNSRRHIVSAWNPAALHEMALPPCHVLSQFVVDSQAKELSCCLYQRSGDWGLGIPFNIASYSLLCLIIAQLTGLKAKEFVHYVANAHVYKNHIGPLQEQLSRLPRPFPRVEINKAVEDIDSLKSSDIKLIGYEPFPAIKMEMAV